MALRKVIAQRLFNKSRISSPSFGTLVPPNAAKTNFHREFLTASESGDYGFFRRFLHRRAANMPTKLPDFLTVPVGDKLKEKLRGMNIAGDRLRLDELIPPAPATNSTEGISIQDARKLLNLSQMEKLKAELRQIPKSSITFSEFVQICVRGCSNEDQGTKLAKMLDESGNVIVLGNVVFLRPEEVAKSMETIISQSIAAPDDPRRKELEQMEQQKAQIDKQAETLVRGELYCGLGFLIAQTLGFMRLTFWELSWDVMEPICFFVTSLHFALAYAFFLRTAREPSFEGFFQRRFRTKQQRLMKIHNFDIEKYSHLKKACYTNYSPNRCSLNSEAPFNHSHGAQGMFIGAGYH